MNPRHLANVLNTKPVAMWISRPLRDARWRDGWRSAGTGLRGRDTGGTLCKPTPHHSV